MALEVCILGERGQPAHSVSIGVKEHSALIGLARRHAKALLMRLADYYEDASYEKEELSALRDELVDVARVEEAEGMRPLIQSLEELLGRAMHSGVGVQVLAD